MSPGAAENQPPPLEGYDLFGENRPLVEARARARAAALGGAARRELGRVARRRAARVGPPGQRAPAGAAHARPLRRADRRGRVPPGLAPAAASSASRHGLHALPWREPAPGAHVARAALFVTLAQVEAGVGCPLSMTYAAVPALRADPELAAEWEPRLTSLAYDPALRPAAEKAGALCGMAMTERQGGSDVRANTTTARAARRRRRGALDGHKWFCSAPMCDAFLVLAQAPAGSSCFLVPRVLPGRRAQRHPPRAPEGQARQPLERLGRDRARGRVGAARRRGGPRRPDDPRDGRPHAARLRARLDGADAAGGRRGDAPRRAPRRVRARRSSTSR